MQVAVITPTQKLQLVSTLITKSKWQGYLCQNSTLPCLSKGPPAGGASGRIPPLISLPASSSTAGPTLQVDRRVAVQAVGLALMRMVLPALLKMSRAAVSKALQGKQVC